MEGGDINNENVDISNTEQGDVSTDMKEQPPKPEKLPSRTHSQVKRDQVELAKHVAEEAEAADRVRRLKDLFSQMADVRKTQRIAPREDKIPDVMKYRPADENKPKIQKKAFKFDISKHGYIPVITKAQRNMMRSSSHGYMPGYVGQNRMYANMDHGYIPYMSSVTASDAQLDHGFVQFSNQPKTVSVHWDNGYMPNSISREPKFGLADHHYVPEYHREGGQHGGEAGGKGAVWTPEGTEGGGMSENDLAVFASVQMLRDRFDQEGGSESQMSLSQSASAFNSGDEVTQDVDGGDQSDENQAGNNGRTAANAENAANAGTMGTVGTVGVDGTVGTIGAEGTDGTIGAAGTVGTIGSEGTEGPAGTVGGTEGQKEGDENAKAEGGDVDASNAEGQGGETKEGDSNENDNDNDNYNENNQEGDLSASNAQQQGGLTDGNENNADVGAQGNENNLGAAKLGGENQEGDVKDSDTALEGGDESAKAANGNIEGADNAVEGGDESSKGVDEGEGGASGPGKLGNIDMDIPMVLPGDGQQPKAKGVRSDEDVDLNYNQDYGKTVVNQGTGLKGNPDADEYGVEVDNGRNLRGNMANDEYGIEVDNNQRLKGNKGPNEYGGEYENKPEQVVFNYNKEYGGEYESKPGEHLEVKANEEYGGTWESNPTRDPNVLVSGQKVDDSYEIDYKNLKNMFERR